jgi:hypothetical protein
MSSEQINPTHKLFITAFQEVRGVVCLSKAQRILG